MRDWAGSLVRAYYFYLVQLTPPLSAGPGVVSAYLSVCFSSVPTTPPAQYGAMVWVIGPRNIGTGLWVFRVRFCCCPADALLSSEPGGGQGNLATHTVAQDCICLLYTSDAADE